MADDVREEDEWLYGESEESETISSLKRESATAAAASSSQESEDDLSRSQQHLPPSTEEGEGFEGDAGEKEGDEEDTAEGTQQKEPGDNAMEEDDDDEDDDDDDDDDSDEDDDDGVQVTIGEIKAAAPVPFAAAPTKRSGPPPDKKGKFSVEDFESPGTINGVAALDFNVDSVEDKPWRKPGADITDYFNYGFTEDTWRAYCDRQKRMRFEAGSSGSGMGPQNPPGKPDSRGIIAVQINNDNSKYGGSGNASIIFPKKFGMNPMRVKEEMRRREEPKENTIQVMTADRREYSRKNFDMPPPPHGPHVPPFAPPPFDTSVPPPPFPPPGPEYMPNPEYFNHPPPPPYYHEEHSGYDEQQWMEPGWGDMNVDMSRPPPGSAVVSLTKASNVPPPPGEGDSTPPTIIKDEQSPD